MGTPGVFKLNIALPNGGAVTLECADRELVRELLYSALPQLSGTPAPAAATPSPAPGPLPGDLMPGDETPAHHSNGNGSVNGNGAYHEPMPAAPMPPPTPAPTPTPPPAGYAPAPVAAAYPPAANGRETVPPYHYNPADASPAYHPPAAQQFADAAAPALSPTPTIPEMQHGAGIPNGNGVPSNGIPANGHAYPVNGNGSGNGHSPHHHSYPANGSSNANPHPAAPVPDAAPTPPPTPAVEPATLDENDFVAFCHQVSPLGDMRRVVVAAEAADRYLGIASVDPDELARLFRLAGWPLPHNFVQTLRNAARSKFRWLERITGQSGHYRVTDTGRSIVLGEGKGTLTALTPTAIPSNLPTPTPALAGVAG